MAFIFWICGVGLIVCAIIVLVKTIKLGNQIPNKKQVYIVILALLALGGIFLFIHSYEKKEADKKETVAWKTKDNSTMAYIMMQDFVKRRLKSPASAKFPFASEQDISIQKDEHEYVIFAYVDSQNSFGAMIRTYYSGVVKQIDAENWQLVTLDIGE